MKKYKENFNVSSEVLYLEVCEWMKGLVFFRYLYIPINLHHSYYWLVIILQNSPFFYS